MSTDSFVTVNGFVSTVRKDEKFDCVRFRIGRDLFAGVENVSMEARLPEDYKDKFGSLKKLMDVVPDSVLDYRLELSSDSLDIYAVTEVTVRCAFAIFFREHVKNKKLMLLSEKTMTFRVRDVTAPVEEETICIGTGGIFGEDGDY